jgi:Smg protein
MLERVITIISIISQYLIEDIDVFDQEMEIVEDLMSLGFETGEIEAAFNWIANLSQGIKRGDEALDAEELGQYVRIFTAEEKRLLTNPARGYLMKLHNLDLVNAPLLEEIIDQAMLLDTPAVGVEEIKMISTMVVMFSQSAADAKTRFLRFVEADAEVMYH